MVEYEKPEDYKEMFKDVMTETYFAMVTLRKVYEKYKQVFFDDMLEDWEKGDGFFPLLVPGIHMDEEEYWEIHKYLKGLQLKYDREHEPLDVEEILEENIEGNEGENKNK